MKLTRSFTVPLPKERIDLYRWVTEMTSADYRSYAPRAHRCLGSHHEQGRLHVACIETIGNELLQHVYVLRNHRADWLDFYSPASRAYVLRWFPATVGVAWTLRIDPIDATSSLLTCSIGVDFPNALVALGAYANSLGFLFLRRHLAEEGAAFAEDLGFKFGA